MSIKELMEAVERFQKPLSRDASLQEEDAWLAHKRASALYVAGSLTNPTPITRGRLEALGFAYTPETEWHREGWVLRVCDHTEVVGWYFTDPTATPMLFLRNPKTNAGVELVPQPQTMGDLNFLLLRLNRKDK